MRLEGGSRTAGLPQGQQPIQDLIERRWGIALLHRQGTAITAKRQLQRVPEMFGDFQLLLFDGQIQCDQDAISQATINGFGHGFIPFPVPGSGAILPAAEL